MAAATALGSPPSGLGGSDGRRGPTSSSSPGGCGGGAARGGGRRLLPAALLLSVALLSLSLLLPSPPAQEGNGTQAFVGGTATARRQGGQLRPGAAGESRIHSSPRASFSWETEVRPTFPETSGEMIQQAADAVMRAYRDGNVRQAIRFRLDQMFDLEQLYVKGHAALQNKTISVMRGFTKRLWGGEFLTGLTTNAVEEAPGVATMIYREAENSMQDIAVLYLPGRECMSSPQMQSYVSRFEDRLIVLINTENAIDPFAVDVKGREFEIEGKADIGRTIAETFSMQTYYYYQGAFNNWLTTWFRVYPNKWELYIENLDYETVLLGEFDKKLGSADTVRVMEKYEEENGIRSAMKVGKMLKDFQAQEQLTEEREPGWRYSKRDFSDGV